MNRLTELYTDLEIEIHNSEPEARHLEKGDFRPKNNALLSDCVQKLGQLEDIEDKLNLWGVEKEQRSLINFLKLILASENGFYYKKDDKIYFCRWCVRVGLQLVEVLPCYAVKETTLQSCYYGDVEKFKELKDAHYWDWKTCLNVHLRDYGKTWALTKEELENGKKEN